MMDPPDTSFIRGSCLRKLYSCLHRADAKARDRRGQRFCQITSFMRPNVKSLYRVDVELQTNMYDCGLHALDMTTELAYGFDPAVCLHGIASTQVNIIWNGQWGTICASIHGTWFKHQKSLMCITVQLTIQLSEEKRATSITTVLCRKFFASCS